MLNYKHIILGLLILSLGGLTGFAQRFKLDPKSEYEAKTIIIKFRKGQNPNANDSLKAYLTRIGSIKLTKLFPLKRELSNEVNERGEKKIDLSRIYKITYSADIPIETVVNAILTKGKVDYAEPLYHNQLLYTPNDPSLPSEPYLDVIHAIEGWDICQGDTNVVIGILDTGTDNNHPDLIGNFKYNYNEPINGIDDDGDGYIDNFRGWDIGDNDNNPQANAANPHGIWVSGLAAASTDNGIGMASVGFKCKLLPVKVLDTAGSLNKGYDGVVYAADHGCKVINISWGGVGNPGSLAQDAINYAYINNDVVIVSAAGNNGTTSTPEDPFFPASFPNVLSVANTTNQDLKYSGSSYGRYIGICAPGVTPYRTDYGGGYRTAGSGTSFSSPIVAGAVAVVRSYYPQFNALQTCQWLKETSDQIDTLLNNSIYKDKLGYGRVNLYRALHDTHVKSLYIISDSIADNNDNIIQSNDTMLVSAKFYNLFEPLKNMVCSLSCTSPYLTIINNTITIGAIDSNTIVNNYSNPFKVFISPNTPSDQTITLRFDFYDGTYHRFKLFDVQINKPYVDYSIGTIASTATNIGRIGFNDELNTQGNGFQFNGNQLLYASSLMIGNSAINVSDATYGSSVTPYNSDFKLLKTIDSKPNSFSDLDISARFNDDNAVNKLKVEVQQNTYTWSLAPYNNYTLFEYTVVNKGASVLNNLYVGIYTDFDIANSLSNRGVYDTIDKMGYTYSPDNSVYAGVKLVTAQTANYYAVENGGTNGSIKVYDGFTKAEKFKTLSLPRYVSAQTDISQTVSAGPLSIAVGDSAKVTFAIIGANSLAQLKQTAQSIADNYGFTYTSKIIANNNCYGQSLGSAKTSPKGGTPPYSFKWNDKNNQTDSIATNLKAGNYLVTVSDAISNKRLVHITVLQPDSLYAKIVNVKEQLCLSDSLASATVLHKGGTSPFSYSWNNNKHETDSIALHLYAGDFKVTVTDNYGCTTNANISINSNNVLHDSIIGYRYIGCKEVCAGNLQSITFGGVKPYTYFWSSAATDSVADALCIGSYKVTIIDKEGCVLIDSSTIMNSPAVSLIEIDKKDPLCNADTNGIIRVKGDNGTPPFTYYWNTGSHDSTLINLSAGNYIVTVTDKKKCIKTDLITLTNPIQLTSTVDSIIGVSCSGICDGRVQVSGNGGNPPYYYQWNDFDYQKSAKAINLCHGKYLVKITDKNNCQTNDSVEINEPVQLSISFKGISPLCFGANNGSLTALINGGVFPYKYTWKGMTDTTESLLNIKANNFSLEVKDKNGCLLIGDTTINQPQIIKLSTKILSSVSCYGSCDGRITVSAEGGVGGFSYLWLPLGTIKPTEANLCAGTYKVVVKDSNGCKDSANQILDTPTKINLNATIHNQTTNIVCDGTINIIADGGNSPYLYTWGNGASTSNINNLCTGKYGLNITDALGCAIDTSFTILKALGIDELLELDNLVLFQNEPNPALGITYIPVYTQNDLIAEFEVIDMFGKSVYISKRFSLNSGMNRIELNLENFNSGIYVYRLITSNTILSKKIIVGF